MPKIEKLKGFVQLIVQLIEWYKSLDTKYIYICMYVCRDKGPTHILAFGPWPRVWVVRGQTNGNKWFNPRT